MANSGGNGGSSDRFPSLGSKITVDGDLSHELLLGRKVMTNLDRVLKSRDITANKGHRVKVMVFPVVTYS